MGRHTRSRRASWALLSRRRRAATLIAAASGFVAVGAGTAAAVWKAALSQPSGSQSTATITEAFDNTGPYP